MGKKRRIIIIAVPLSIGIPLLAAALAFVFRPPVLMVSDPVFDSLYGVLRGRIKQAEVSIRLWRRVKTVRIADDAGEDVAVFTVRSAAETPFCVLFPYRYYNEAKRYAGEAPGIPVAVFRGRVRDPSEPVAAENFHILGTDSVLDFYRAGQCAAIFAQSGSAVKRKVSPDGESAEEGESPVSVENEPGEVFLLQDDLVSDGDRDAFSRGLAEKGHERTPVYQNAGTAFTPRPNTACVVTSGAAQNFLEQSLDIPVLLFSWLDPALTPARIKLIFDDSPWALAVPAVKIIGRQGEAGTMQDIPSEIRLLSRRINERERLGNIRRAIRSQYIP
ncbi:hypothetical protein AGMMS50267_16750 [Spirochaetia bacterium]|nr:hypothetical protein AGMMS50267_16750 [Spirochaetia bacterium]